MRLAIGLGVVVLGAACQGPVGPEWKTWNAQQLADLAAKGATIAGIPVRSLATVPGLDGGVPFRGPDYGEGPVRLEVGGPAMLPAFAEGGLAAYFVTEVWWNVPQQVVQPIYAWVTGWDPSRGPANRLTVSGTPADGDLVPTVFGVGPNSAFASPFWKAHFVVPRQGETIGFDSAQDVRELLSLAAEEGIHDGPLVGCPIIPEGVNFLGVRGERPLSGTPVKRLTPFPFDGVRNAWVDREIVKYVDLGPGTLQVDPDQGYVKWVWIYNFVSGDPEKPTRLTLPAVLSSAARENALAQQVNVYLNSTDYEVFVPRGALWNNVRQALVDQKVLAPDLVDAAIPDAVAKELSLKVAVRPASVAAGTCFESAAALGTRCTWLDSEAAIKTHTLPFQRLQTTVRLSVWTMLFNGAIP